MELSKEMAYQIVQELIGDANKVMQDAQRLLQNPTRAEATVEYRDIESLRYIIKQMETKVRILGGGAGHE